MDGEARGRMGKECLHHGFNLARQKRIIRIELADQVSARALVGGIQVGRHAAVRIAQQAYSVTAADIGGNHIAGIVLGGIIAYDDFRWGIGLRPCDARHGRERGSSTRCQMQKLSSVRKFHCVPLNDLATGISRTSSQKIHRFSMFTEGAGGGSCAGFRTPECRGHPRALAAGVGKAPRHEIAVGGALAVPRALWGIERGVGLKENDAKRSSLWL